jgi:hypothetical protein
MDEKQLIEKMADSTGTVPVQAEVFAVRQYSLEDLTRRAKRLLGMTADVCKLSLDRGDWVQQADRTLVRLPMGGRAMVHHASGAMKVTTGLAPMESLFAKIEARESLKKLVEATAARMRIDEWAGHNESLNFERLWQIKASAADQEHKAVEPVLCRVVGAYRQFVGKLPVWGAASVAIKLAAGGALDSVSIQTRETTGESIEWAPVVRPDEAARQILLQLGSLMGRSKVPFAELAAPQWMRFGYASLGKRKSQRILAPHYVAAIGIAGQDEAQAYQFVVPATERTYLPLCQVGSPAALALQRRAG